MIEALVRYFEVPKETDALKDQVRRRLSKLLRILNILTVVVAHSMVVAHSTVVVAHSTITYQPHEKAHVFHQAIFVIKFGDNTKTGWNIRLLIRSYFS